MKSSYYLRDSCRLCQGHRLELVLPLKPTPLCDAYVKTSHLDHEQEVFPLDLYLCRDCGFAQIGCVVDPEIIYRDYIYVSSSSLGLSEHFKTYAMEAIDRLKLEPQALVVDIGSNDGMLLKDFKANGFQVLGVEPATEIANAATFSGVKTYPDFLDDLLVEKILKEHAHADVITVNNLFANIDDLMSFSDNIVKLLAPEGVIIIESSYLADMIGNMVFDFIYHEHLSYLSILPLKMFFAGYGMKLIGLQHVPTKGGSMRYYFAKKSSKRSINPEVGDWIEKEKKSRINSPITYKTFEGRIDSCRNQLIDELNKYNEAIMVGYGASATSTTLIYHFGLQDCLNFLVDDNPAKIGTYSPGLHLPVKDSSVLYDENVDAVVILAWRYADQIMKKHPEYKGRFIVPLPKLKVY